MQGRGTSKVWLKIYIYVYVLKKSFVVLRPCNMYRVYCMYHVESVLVNEFPRKCIQTCMEYTKIVSRVGLYIQNDMHGINP